jgi:hypothetical protein
VGFDVRSQRLIRFFISSPYCRKNGNIMILFINFNKVYDSLRTEALCNILIEFRIYRKLTGLIIMCKRNLQRSKYGQKSVKFPIQNGLK